MRSVGIATALVLAAIVAGCQTVPTQEERAMIDELLVLARDQGGLVPVDKERMAAMVMHANIELEHYELPRVFSVFEGKARVLYMSRPISDGKVSYKVYVGVQTTQLESKQTLKQLLKSPGDVYFRVFEYRDGGGSYVDRED